ncbi:MULTISPECIES: hypothetical protein [Pseudomonas]|uniref:Peptidase M12 n=1 Tax=Pseudomonas frederiksbergensis TaxID=104087 RepID=A0A2S8HTQ8_9PSED|nr:MULTISPECIES: hypothetical protein [Pseudomonas]PQP05933.1 hypothetical protein C5612_04680 [Pseudomonas frederiksbergensis]WLG51982.1 hypothetical protein PSH64_05530 [Pseudomonas sp. FP1742]
MNSATTCLTGKPEDNQASYEAAIAENPANCPTSASGRQKRAVAIHTKFWAPGRTLRIAFLNGSQAFKDGVKAAASNWLPHINLKFDFVEGEVGDIRIRTEPGTYWSKIGTDALLVEEGPTMVIADWMLVPKLFAHYVMHEFGHALGAEHEHLHPEANIPWNKPAVYLAHGVPEDADESDFRRKTVDDRYFNLLDTSEVNYSPYDPKSIMHYEIRQAWTHGDFQIFLNLVLSEKDKAFMTKAYPYPEQTTE